MLQRYQGNLKQALEDIFPNVRVAEANMNSGMPSIPSTLPFSSPAPLSFLIFTFIDNILAASGSDRPQQRFLEEIVLADGFDPLVPGNRSHHKNVVCSFKVLV